MRSSSTRSPKKNSGTLKRRPIISQPWLDGIAGLEELRKMWDELIRNQHEKVLEALDAGAPVEPGKYKVKVKTRPRRRKTG